MKKYKIIVFVLTIILIILTTFYVRYIAYKKKINLINNSSFDKYAELYIKSKNIKNVEDTNDFIDFINKYDHELSKTLSKIDLHFLNGLFYSTGYNKIDDSLKNTYNGLNINFFESLRINGDHIINVTNRHIYFNNILYCVSNDSIFEKEKINIPSIFKDYLSCNNIRTKGITSEGYKTAYLWFKNGNIEVEDNSFSQETINLFVDSFRKSEYFIKKESYFIKLKTYNIEDIECFEPDPKETKIRSEKD